MTLVLPPASAHTFTPNITPEYKNIIVATDVPFLPGMFDYTMVHKLPLGEEKEKIEEMWQKK